MGPCGSLYMGPCGSLYMGPGGSLWVLREQVGQKEFTWEHLPPDGSRGVQVGPNRTDGSS